MPQRNKKERAEMLAQRRVHQRMRVATVNRIKPTKNNNPEYRK
jgi:hypothetical protein